MGCGLRHAGAPVCQLNMEACSSRAYGSLDIRSLGIHAQGFITVIRTASTRTAATALSFAVARFAVRPPPPSPPPTRRRRASGSPPTRCSWWRPPPSGSTSRQRRCGEQGTVVVGLWVGCTGSSEVASLCRCATSICCWISTLDRRPGFSGVLRRRCLLRLLPSPPPAGQQLHARGTKARRGHRADQAGAEGVRSAAPPADGGGGRQGASRCRGGGTLQVASMPLNAACCPPAGALCNTLTAYPRGRFAVSVCRVTASRRPLPALSRR